MDVLKTKNKLVKKNIAKITKILEKNRVVLAVLFGSGAKGKTGPLSDIDFAVLLPGSPSSQKRFNRQLILKNALEQILNKPVDILILNSAPPLIAQMAVAHGQVIYCQDEDIKASVFTNILKGYDDAAYLSLIQRKYLEARVFNNKMGEAL